MKKLFYGDNLDVMRKYIKDETVDLCYIDPPFNSKRNYNQIYNGNGKEDKAQSIAFIDTWSWNDAADCGLNEILYDGGRHYTGQTIALIDGLKLVLGETPMFAYIISMTQRINEIWRILKPTGSFYLHCDPTMSHYLKLVLDSVFCPRGGDFRNEIVWHYQTGGAGKRSFAKKHELIFFYNKDRSDYFFAPERVKDKRSRKSLERAKNPKGARISALNVMKLPSDVWDIQALNPQARERLGYPTQKPEKLLERIILASSNEGDVVFDAYCGCGTTVAVAERLKRNWIGIDITFQSISLILKRLEDTYGQDVRKSVELMGIPQDIRSAESLAHKKDDRLRKEFEKWAMLTYSNNRAIINEKKGKDYGIDGYAYSFGTGTKNKILFSVKSGHVNSSQIRDLRGTIERENALGGVFITLEEPSKDMIEEAEKAGIIENAFSAETHHKIEIVTIRKILDGAVLSIPVGSVLKTAPRYEKEQGKQLRFG